MIKIYGYYPLGYRRILSQGEMKNDAGADPRVTEFYRKWQYDRAAIRSWDSRSEVIRLALALFGDMKQWLREQQDNEELSAYGWRFLEETIRFINTGRREINIRNNTSLILSEKEDRLIMPLEKRQNKLIDLVGESDDTIIARWLRHPGGYDDLVQTITVVFGDTRSKDFLTWYV